jgi:hypothetical protein
MGAGTLVLLVTHFFRAWPTARGSFAMFPVMASVLVVFRTGIRRCFCGSFVVGMVLGYYASSSLHILTLMLPVTVLSASRFSCRWGPSWSKQFSAPPPVARPTIALHRRPPCAAGSKALMETVDILKREIKVLAFDQYGTIVDMQKGSPRSSHPS